MSGLPLLVLDGHFAIVDKPSGLPVHRSFHVRVADVALQRVRNQLKRRVNPVHRLDQPTSGCLMFGFGKRWTGRMHSSLRDPSATKTYLAMVRGCWPHEGPIVVETPMKGDDGVLKEARSIVECLGRSDEPRCSLLRVTPQTGRYHQVRRHVRDMHHPVLGDSKHGDSRINRHWRGEGLHRLALHSLCLDLPHPTVEGSRVVAVSPPPSELAELWARMPWWTDALAAEPRLALPPSLAPAVGRTLYTAQCWDGSAAQPHEIAAIAVIPAEDSVRIEVTAPFHGDPPPPGAGSTWQLWDHEVVELFLVGADGRYTEIELGPHGHFLVLRLEGERQVVERELPIEFEATIDGGHWRGVATVPRALLPDGPWRANAYAIHGTGAARRYLVHTPLGTEAPDFHKIDLFSKLMAG